MQPAEYLIHDERFSKLVNGTATLERLHTGCLWSEGPAWFAAGRYVIWSDIPNNRMMRFDETDGSVSVFRQPSNNSNGNTVDRMGRLVSCEHGARRVTRTNFDGTVEVLADNWQGKRLNSPNDVVVKSDGSVWFTDPTYGIDSDYEGNKGESEVGASYVYRVDPETGAVDAVITDMIKPNGIAFSPDESKLYVVDTGRSHGPQHPAHMRVFDVAGDGSLSGGAVFADCLAGFFDGFRFDSAGRIWVGAADGVHCYEPDGTLIGRILVPETTANVVFGGEKLNCLYITATTSLYRIRLMVNGHKTF